MITDAKADQRVVTATFEQAEEVLAATLPNYESRPQQQRLAVKIEDALASGEHLIAEAGCGTGKSLGYLIPAILSDKRVVVSTVTKALQDQVGNKDLPFLTEHLGVDFEYFVLKGRSERPGLRGDTAVLTYEGTRSIADIAMQSAVLLDGDGNWTECEVRSRVDQWTVEIKLSRSGVPMTIVTTPSHPWFVERNANFPRDLVEVPAVSLESGDRLKWGGTRPLVRSGKTIRPSAFGIAHGIVFGDGTRFGETTGGWRTATLTLYGDKKADLLPWFTNSHHYEFDPGEEYADRVAIRVVDLPVAFKSFPSLDEAPSYLYGWLAGYFAADGSATTGRNAALASARRENLEFVTTICNRLGIAHGSIGSYERVGKGQVPTPLYSINLSIETLTPDFFLRPHHRRAVEDYQALRTYKQWRAARRWKIEAVQTKREKVEVFDAIVPTTNSFVLAGNILTGTSPNTQGT